MAEYYDENIAFGLRIIHIVLTTVILLPICAYCGYQLYKTWDEFYMQKRHSIILLFIYIFACYGPLFEYPYYAILKLTNPNAWYYHSPNEIVIVFSLLPRFASISFLTLRIYILWYDHQYAKVVTSSKWQLIVNPTFLDKNWFWQHKRKYGNTSYLIKHIVLPTVFSYYFTFLIIHISIHKNSLASTLHSITMIFTVFWMLSHAIICIMCWKRYPSFLDNLFIRNELKITIKLLVTIPLFVAITSIFGIFGYHDEEATVICMWFSASASTVLCWIMVIYPKTKCNPKVYGQIKNIRQEVVASIQEKHLFNSWKEIVFIKEGYESFGNFLEKEFAIENLMVITEYMMIINIMKNNNETNGIIINDLKYNLKLPDSLEICLIAKELEENKISYIEATNKLYCKYINPYANMAINISYKVKNDLMNIFSSTQFSTNTIDNKKFKIVISLLECAVNEISYLLNDSFLRFRKTDVFQELLQCLNENYVFDITDSEPYIE